MINEKFINECKNRANANRLGKITINGIEKPITNSDNLQSFSIDSGCYVDGNIIGSVYAKCLSASFITDIADLSEKSIYAQIGVKYDDSKAEHISMGKYRVERPNNEITANMSQITAYDDLYTNLDNKYVCGIDYSKGNITVRDLYIDICNQLGLTPKTTSFLNDNIPIEDNPFTNGEKNRTVLQTVCKISCSFVDVDVETNEIDLCWLSQSEEPDYTFYKNDYVSTEGGQVVCGPINCLIIKNSQIDSENVTKKDDKDIAINGEHSITISEDYILHNEELRQLAINNIWNRVHGMKYVDCKLTTYYGKPFLKLGNKIRVYIDDNNTKYFDTYVLKHNFTYDGSFNSIIESPALTQQEIKSKQDISLGQALLNTQIDVDKQNKKITALVQETSATQEKVTQLEETTDGIKTSVSTVEKDLATTNSNLEQTNKNVDALSGKIDGVSADFTNFKDNEYVKSIENLQDQIDGAIQFWNGSAIPTINNYPANEWTTENDRNNHRADIYTVIEDVNGELKQGKSYRFDKVNGVWQWIELTDNELSAVQALAQQALDKSNKNADDIGVLNKKTSELSLTDEQIRASVEELNNQYEQDITITKTVEGNNTLYLENAKEDNALEYVIEGKSEQNISDQSDNLFDINGEIESSSSGYSLENNTLTFPTTSGNAGNMWYSKKYSSGNYNFITDILTGGVVRTLIRILNSNNEIVTDIQIQGYSTYNTTYKGFWCDDKGTNIVRSISVPEGYYFKLGFAYLWYSITNVQLKKDDKSTDYVPFAPNKPSPDYPSEVKSICGVENVLEMSVFDSMHSNGSTNTYDNINHRITFNSDSILSGSGRYKYLPINAKLGDTLTIVFEIRCSKSGSVRNGFGGKNTTITCDNNWIKVTNNYVVTDSNINSLPFTIYTANSTDFTKDDWIEFRNVALYKNVNDIDYYVPYGNWLKGKINGNNLLNINDIVLRNSGASLEVDQNTFTLNNANSGANNYVWVNIPVEVGETYTIGYSDMGGVADNSNNRLQYSFSDIKIDSYSADIFGNQTTVNKTDKCSTSIATGKYLILTFRIGNGSNYTITDVQVENGDNATEYEPYKEQEVLIDLNKYDEEGNVVGYYELSKINDTRDELEVVSGKFTERIGKYTFTGDENFVANQIDTDRVVYLLNKFNNKKVGADNAICSHFKYKGNAQLQTLGNCFSFNEAEQYKSFLYFQFEETIVPKNNVDKCKAFFKRQYDAGTPVTIYYELETPQTYQLTPINVELFKGYNRITLEDKYGIVEELEMTYLTDSKLNGQYATKTELKLTADSITSEVNKKVSTDNFNSTVEDISNKMTQTANETNSTLQEILNTNDEQETKINSLTQTANGLNIEISEQKKSYDSLNGKLVDIEGTLKDMTFDFSTKGLAIGTSTDANNSLLDNTGIKVYNYDKLNAIFNNRGSGLDKLIVTGTAQIGYLKFVKSTKNGKPGTKIFYVKKSIESLEDLL